MLLITTIPLILLGVITASIYFYGFGVLTISFLIVGSLFVLCLCTEALREKFLRRCYRLGSDNNAIILPLWIIVGISMLFSIEEVINPGDNIQKAQSVAQKIKSSDEMPVNLGAHGPRLWNQYLCTRQIPIDTDAAQYENAIKKCVEAREKANQQERPSQKPSGHHWITSFLWILVSWHTTSLFFIAIGCTIYVLRDEMGRAWKAAENKILERGGKPQDLKDRENPNPGTTTPLTPVTTNHPKLSTRFAEYFTVTFVFELLEQVYKHLRTRKVV